MRQADLNGGITWWFSRVHAAFSGLKSTVLLGLLSHLATTCILVHHVVGVPTGTLLIMPSATSCANISVIWSRQWIGTVAAILVAIGVAVLSTWILIGSDFIIGNGWCLHVFNVDAVNCFSSHDFIATMLSSVGRKVSSVGLPGGGVCLGHPQGALTVSLSSTTAIMAALILGKSGPMIPS
jgi:hypothetical protein